MKVLLALIFTSVTLYVAAQDYPITSITINLPANPDANTVNWKSGASILIITANAKLVNNKVDPRLSESKMLVTVMKANTKVCGVYNASTAPASNITTVTKTWSGNNAVSYLGQDCILPPGEYQICVQIFGSYSMQQLSAEKCKTFTISEKKEQVYQGPQNLVPVNESVITETNAKKPFTFRWTPVIPRPPENIIYRVNIWQLMQGQTATTAIKSNQPVITKDVPDLTQAIITNIITGPCKPPYLCEFVWNVQAINRDGKPVGENNGTSSFFSFKITPSEEIIQPPKLLTPKNNDSIHVGTEVQFSWEAPTPIQSASVSYKIKIVEIKSDESPEQAFRTNKPFFEKDSLNELHVNKPFFEKDSLNQFKPGKKYAWNIQAIDRDGKPVGGNNGTSETFVFKMMQAGCQATLKITKDSCLGLDKDGMYKHRVCATYTADPANSCNILFNHASNNTTNNFGMFQSGQSNIFCTKTPGTSISNFSPALNTLPATLAPGASASFCFDLLAPTNFTGVKLTAFGFCNDNSGNYNTANANDTIPLKQCICDPCKQMDVTIKNDGIKIKDGIADEATLVGQLSGLDPGKIKKLTIELVSFSIEQTGDKECSKCAENRQWGNFIAPSTAFFSGFANGSLNGGNFGREWIWLSKASKDCNGDNNGNGGVGNPKNLCATCPASGKTGDDNKINIAGANPVDVVILPGPPLQKLNTFSLPISIPPGSSLSCCSDKITICIRYTWWDFCCHACDVIKCYTFERKPVKADQNPNPKK